MIEVNHQFRDFIDGRSEENQQILVCISFVAVPCHQLIHIYTIIVVGKSFNMAKIPVNFREEF
jgi:hypothetical protein